MFSRPTKRVSLSPGSFAVALIVVAWTSCLALGVLCACPEKGLSSGSSDKNAAAAQPNGTSEWGDHVGSPLPEYTTGEECLFCHRDDWGNRWARNFHHRTVRSVEGDSAAMQALAADPETKTLAAGVTDLLGTRREIRFLKRSSEYGKFGLLSVGYTPARPGTRGRARGLLSETKGSDDPIKVPANSVRGEVHWDEQVFAKTCAGCHTTAVDPQTHAFSAIALDCYACHGIVDLRHSKDARLVAFGKGNPDPPRVQLANCAQCHLRAGKSKASGLPYPTNFVIGDNLLRDYQVDWSDEALAKMNPGDRHVVQNVREVMEGKSTTTCVSCHDIHRQSATKHHQVAQGATCVSCHEPAKPMSKATKYEVHSALCGY
jgi:hypothetical protein